MPSRGKGDTDRLEVMSDVDAHGHAMDTPIRSVVVELVDLLGAPLVAVIGGVGETRAVMQWTGDRKPQRPNVLRFALQIATMIARSGDREIARAWFEGSNPHLADTTPALLLRNLPLEDIQPKLMTAARGFASRGRSQLAEG
jgi:hypothetical protein